MAIASIMSSKVHTSIADYSSVTPLPLEQRLFKILLFPGASNRPWSDLPALEEAACSARRPQGCESFVAAFRRLMLAQVNVLVNGNGDAVLADFGLSRVNRDISIRSSVANPTGTPRWMAPERLREGKLTAATDVYAYALTAFEESAHASHCPLHSRH
jgi:hypothetical protein